MKVGIIGLGAISSAHIEAILQCKALNLCAVCDVDKKRLDEFVARYGVKGFGDYRRLLKAGVDIAVVTVPHSLHYEVGMEAVRQDCHVLIEKPFAITMGQCRNLFKAANRAKVKVMTADTAYHGAKIKKAKQIVQSGMLGRFISGSLVNYRDYFTPNRPKWFLQPKLSGGGQLINVGVHRIATVRSIIGSDEITVKASIGFYQPNCQVEGNGSVFVGYRDGSAFLLEENGYYGLNRRLEKTCHFNFEKGVITLTNRLHIVHKDGSIEFPSVPKEKNAYLPIYKELIEAIQEERDPFPGAKEGIMDVRVILASYESAKEGKEVRLDDKRWQFNS